MYKYIYTNIRDAILIGRERIEIITKFISENQYCKAEDVVQGVKDNISRVPVYGTLAKMMKEGLLYLFQ
jgi:Fe2+ or Zn2+ uptake regulation protein